MPTTVRRSRVAASILALLTALSIWLSSGTVAVYGGDTSRIAALPSFQILGLLAIAAVGASWLAKLRLHQAWPLAISLLLWLPFLPGALPASFVMWEGPIEGIVWLCVIAGLIASWPVSLPKIAADPARAPWLAASLLVLAAVTTFVEVRSVIPGGDEPHYLAATQSLLHDGDLRVANNYAQGEYLDYFPGKLEPHYLKRGKTGEIYSIHAPGVSVIVLPAFAIAGYAGAVATMILLAALTAALTWRLAFRVSGDAGGAWAGTLAVFATAPYFFHAFTIYPEIIGSLCVVCGMWLLMELADGREVTSRSLMAVGTALAILPWLHSRFAVLAAILGVLIAIRLAQRRAAVSSIATFLAVPAVAGAAWFTFFYVIWGIASPAAPYGADTSTSASFVLRGLAGLLVDQQFGVITTAPIYLFAIVGGLVLLAKRPRLAIELALIVVPYAVAVASYAMWWAGAAAPARFVVSILPLAALPIAVMWPKSRTLAGLVLIASLALLVPRTFVDGGRFIYNNRGGIDAMLQWLTSSVDLPSALPSVHRTGGSIAVRDAAIWIVGAGVAALLGAVALRRWTVGARFAMTAVLMAIAVMISSSTVWTVSAASPFDVRHSQVAALERFHPAWHTAMLDAAWHRRSPQSFLDDLATTFRVEAPKAIGRMAAGEYELVASEAPAAPDRVALYVGRNDVPIESPTLDQLRDVVSPFRFRLPVAVRALNARIDSSAPSSGAELTLRPVGVIVPETRRAAIRAEDYGHVLAFFFDEWAYPERDGFWTRANGSTDVVFDASDPARQAGLPIAIVAGAVPTTVKLSVGDWRESYKLAAGQRQEVLLPASPGRLWLLRIASGAGARPSEREPGNTDVRALAAWIAIR